MLTMMMTVAMMVMLMMVIHINANVIVDDEVLVLIGPGLKLQLYHPQALC